MFNISLPRTRVTRIGPLLLDITLNIFVNIIFIVKFRLCDHDMQCASGKKCNGRINRACGTCSSTSKKLYIHHHNGCSHQVWQVGDLDGLPPRKSHYPLILRFCGITWQTKAIISPYHNAHGQQTWHGGNIQEGTLKYKVLWSFNHLVLWGHARNWIPFISICTKVYQT